MKKIKISLLFLFCGFIFHAYGQRDSTEIFESGKNIFNTHCASCHGVHQGKLGPMLASITRKRSEAWLLSFIRNSQEVILSGDAYAGFLFQQYNRVVMPSFEQQLSDKKIRDMLTYIAMESENPSEMVNSHLEVNQAYSNADIVKGKAIFNNQCATCHFIGKEGDGPALGSVTRRRPLFWLLAFIHNSQQVIRSGDAYANHLFESYNQQVMPPFDFLTEDEILLILDYIDFASASPHRIAGQNGRKTTQLSSLPAIPSPSPETMPAEKDISGSFLKIFFIIISSLGFLLHAYLVVRLYLYLAKSE